MSKQVKFISILLLVGVAGEFAGYYFMPIPDYRLFYLAITGLCGVFISLTFAEIFLEQDD